MRKLNVYALFFILTAIGWAACTGNPAVSSEIRKETFAFSVQNGDTLKLDKYDLLSADTGNGRTCVLFVFGGGFVNGERDNDSNAAFMRELAKRGYVAVAIDYRLGMKNAGDISDPLAAASLFTHTITIAVEDLFDATRFVYEHADAWNINKDRIVSCGSSAGAFTVLQGEYARSNRSALAQKLPDGFKYGGVIAFAGAIFSEKGEPAWTTTPAPIQLFHGDADRNVPYDKITMGEMGIYGSKPIAETLQALDFPYYFYDVENTAHEMAGLPMTDNLEEIVAFIDRYVEKEQPLQIHSKVKQIGKEELEKELELMDFIRFNYQR